MISNFNTTTTVSLNGRNVRIHGLNSGFVAVKRAFRTKKGPGPLAKLNILLDKQFTDFLPIWFWVIEHPDGSIMIDTGAVTAANVIEAHLGKESGWSRFQMKNSCKFMVPPGDSAEDQLASVNITPKDIDVVLLTHLHLDHTDGIRYFPNKEIIVAKTEFNRPVGNMPSTYPGWFRPKTVSYVAGQCDVFDAAFPISSSGDVLYIPTPGHTRGHSSVLLKTDEFDIIFAGDASYSQAQLLKGEMAGVHYSYKRAAQTYRKILSYGALRRTIYLPSHDPESGKRLVNREFLPIFSIR